MLEPFGPLVVAGKVALLRFSDGTLDRGGVLYREDEQGQLVPVPATDPVFDVHEQWKREIARKVAAARRPNRATRRAATRKKSRSARRKQGKKVQRCN